jgi:hypothetical protein
MAGALARALEMRSHAIHGHNSNSDTDDDFSNEEEEWD